MPVSAEFTQRVVDVLNAARPIRHRKMFGGLGFYFDEIFFAIGDDDKLFFKVDAATIPDYESRGMGPWICEGQMMNAYREVPDDVLTGPDLGDWIDRAVAVAQIKKKKKS